MNFIIWLRMTYEAPHVVNQAPHFSNAVLCAAEYAQRFRTRKHVAWLEKQVVGSDSPAYRQFVWHSHNTTVKDVTWVAAPGDKNASLLARNWDHISILGVAASAVAVAKETYAAYDPVEATAYNVKGKPHVGIRPHGQSFLRQIAPQDPLAAVLSSPDQYAYAVREGRESAEHTAGLWLPNERTLIGFAGVELLMSGQIGLASRQQIVVS